MEELITISGVRGFIDENGIAQLNLEDVARGFGFTETAASGNETIRWRTVKGYLEEFKFIAGSCDGSQQVGKDQFIPENIVYRLGFKAKNDTAEKFQGKIADEILPAIRKHGGYLTPAKIEEVLLNPDTIIRLATDLKEERRKRLEAENTNASLMHVKKSYTAGELAKEIGFKSAQVFNKDLHIKGIQFKQNDTWMLYSEHSGKGYTEIKQSILPNGTIVYDMRWTQIGRTFVLKLYNKMEVAC